MQQRYYDPGIGMFLSVDPVTAYSSPVGQFHRYRYANNNPYTFSDPDGRETRIIVNGNVHLLDPFSWRGKHVGLYMDNGITRGSPIIYDPNGSFGGAMRGSGGFFVDDEANLGEYLRYQFEDGPSVRIYTFATTPEQEMEIAKRFAGPEGGGEPLGFTCATEVSRMLDGVGPFEGLGGHSTPLGLEGRLQEIGTDQTRDIQGFQGAFRVEGRIDSGRLDRQLSD